MQPKIQQILPRTHPIPKGAAPRRMCDDSTNISRRRREECETRSKETIQTLNHRPPRDEWGHTMKEKEKKTVRISFVNVNGIGSKAKSSKSEDIRQYMVENDVDVMGLAETNVNWGKVRNKDTLWDRTKQWFSNRRIGVAYNTHQKLSTNFQPGGTATLATNDIAHRFKRSGFDESGLGRWSWVQITGKKGTAILIISYRVSQTYPSEAGYTTACMQQYIALLKKYVSKPEPRQKLLEDLKKSFPAGHTCTQTSVLFL